MSLKGFFSMLNFTKIGPKVSRVLRNGLWWTSVAVIVATFTWQIIASIKNFNRFEVLNVATSEPQVLKSFPPVYICTHSRSNHIYEGSEMNDVIDFCQYHADTGKTVSCEFTKKKFEVMFRGTLITCAIIKPKKNETSGREITITEIKLEVKFPRTDDATAIGAKVGFHHMATLVDQTTSDMKMDSFHVSPGDSVHVEYSLTEVRRLKSPYTSNCIPENSTYSVFPPFTRAPFKNLGVSYTYYECIQLCHWKNDVDCKMKKWQNCSWDVNYCKCRQPCRASEYQFKIRQSHYMFKKRISQDHHRYNNFTELLDVMWSGKAVIYIKRQSSNMKVVTETPIIQEDSLVGIIGGHLGLWIGQSLLNFVVELHSILAILKDKIKKRLSRKSK